MTVFHGLINVFNGFVVLQPSVTGDSLSAYVIARTNVLFALVIVLVYGTKTFTRGRASVPAATFDD